MSGIFSTVLWKNLIKLEKNILESLIPTRENKLNPRCQAEKPEKVKMKTIFIIEIFEKHSSSFVNQVELEKSELQTMRRIFSVNQDDPYMYNSYKIDDVINEQLYALTGIKVNIQRYDCYGGYRSS